MSMRWAWRGWINSFNEKKAKIIAIIPNFLPFISFLIPMMILYCFEPLSFEKTWKGRTYYMFFLWLFIFETILAYGELRATKKLNGIKSPRTIAFAIFLLIPTIYVITANFYGLNSMIRTYASQNLKMADYFAGNMPICIEYLIFASLFIVIAFLQYGKKGLKFYSIAIFLLTAVGTIYMIDNFYPEGSFTPFQIIVPTTVTLAAIVLNVLGYNAQILPPYKNAPVLRVSDSQGNYSVFAVAWPCSGVDSLLLYTATILLFLKRSSITTLRKTIYFLIGAVITYFINILRIATIFIISLNGGDWRIFHDLYGSLYSITWIIVYPILIVGMESLFSKIKKRRLMHKENSGNPEVNYGNGTLPFK
ncbi:MAG: exosortase/archaeosortase family protein [Candidatus Bathyarchaeales archaeon]